MRNSRKIKGQLGASEVLEAPRAGSSPLGFLGLLAAVRAHLETRSEGPGRPSAEYWTVRRLVPFRRTTWERLKSLARRLGRELPVTPSPAHLAATIIERELAPADGNKANTSREMNSDKTEAAGISRDVEATNLRKAVVGVGSMRGRQRQTALAIARTDRSPAIPIEELRESCRRQRCYNIPNFTQNMKKDRRLFVEVRGKDGNRLQGWDLTAEGKRKALSLRSDLGLRSRTAADSHRKQSPR